MCAVSEIKFDSVGLVTKRRWTSAVISEDNNWSLYFVSLVSCPEPKKFSLSQNIIEPVGTGTCTVGVCVSDVCVTMRCSFGTVSGYFSRVRNNHQSGVEVGGHSPSAWEQNWVTCQFCPIGRFLSPVVRRLWVKKKDSFVLWYTSEMVMIVVFVTAESMRALYGKGIVHRDLKPQNILLAHAGKPNPPPHLITLKIGKSICFSFFPVGGVKLATLG